MSLSCLDNIQFDPQSLALFESQGKDLFDIMLDQEQRPQEIQISTSMEDDLFPENSFSVYDSIGNPYNINYHLPELDEEEITPMFQIRDSCTQRRLNLQSSLIYKKIQKHACKDSRISKRQKLAQCSQLRQIINQMEVLIQQTKRQIVEKIMSDAEGF